MSIARTCPKCYQQEQIRVNFGPNIQAEQEFHREDWCNCGYSSAHEMMADQDMPFSDPKWIPFAKHFLNEYHIRFEQGRIRDNEELVRFFLRLLKFSANNINRSIQLTDKKPGESYQTISDGETDHKPKASIFRDGTMMDCSVALFFAKRSSVNKRVPPSQPVKDEKPNRTFLWMFLSVVAGFILGYLVAL